MIIRSHSDHISNVYRRIPRPAQVSFRGSNFDGWSKESQWTKKYWINQQFVR